MTRAHWVQKATGLAAAHYLRLVWQTTRFIIEPADAFERIPKHAPIILAMWHGQHFLMPFIKPQGLRAKVLISRHRDGEINAVAAERLGIETIRGSGTHGTDFSKKGGVFAFNAIAGRAARQGYNVAMTADVPKVARVAGLGIVKIAQLSGRPIYPIAIATSRRIELDNWDRTTVNLPFGRGGRRRRRADPRAARRRRRDARTRAPRGRGGAQRRDQPRLRAGRSVRRRRRPWLTGRR